MEWRPITGFENSYEVSDEGEIRRISPSCLMHRKLSSEDIGNIKRLVCLRVPNRRIASVFPVTPTIINRIVNGTAYLPKTPKILKQALRRDGYPFVTLCVGGKTKHMAVHIAVAGAFIGPRKEGHEVNHLDGNKTNAHRNNLEYVTRRGNAIHRYDVLKKSHKILLHQANEIRARVKNGESRKALAKEYFVSIPLVDKIVQGKAWHRD